MKEQKYQPLQCISKLRIQDYIHNSQCENELLERNCITAVYTQCYIYHDHVKNISHTRQSI